MLGNLYESVKTAVSKNNHYNHKPKKSGIVLLEFNGWEATHVGQLMFANIIALTKGKFIFSFSNIFFFQNKNFIFIINYLKWLLGKTLNIRTFGIYKKFGVTKIFNVNPSLIDSKKSKEFIKNFYKKKITRQIILNIKLNQILLGDILYDSYLRQNNLETINPYRKDFMDFFEKFIATYFFWRRYFKLNKVDTVISSHPTYIEGLPARIAISENIKAFIVSYHRIYSLNKKNFYPHKEYLDFKKKFSKFNLKKKKKFLKIAQTKISQRFDGKLGDMIYLTKTAYGDIKNKKVLKDSKKTKVLIAAHSFSDSPHARGNGIFEDFYQWLLFLFKLSKDTNYEWYIKCHPDFHEYTDKTVEVIKQLLKEYPNIKWIDPSTSHKQIISDGINLALTVDGSIGLEYPYFGIPVINASKFNCHINYKFNYHPKNVKEYRAKILNFNNLKRNIKINDILECYYMNFIYYSNNWLIDDYNRITKFINQNYRYLNKSKKVYEYFNKHLTDIQVDTIVKNIITFYLSKKYIYNEKNI